MVAQVGAMRQQKNQRDMEIATRIAMTRDRVMWMSGAVAVVATAGIVKRQVPTQFIPPVAITTSILYQTDMAWGSKLNRIKDEALVIRSDEKGWWFNEPMELPPLLKPYYRRLMDDQNKKLANQGLPPAADWAK